MRGDVAFAVEVLRHRASQLAQQQQDAADAMPVTRVVMRPSRVATISISADALRDLTLEECTAWLERGEGHLS